jgi:hypothetical protein
MAASTFRRRRTWPGKTAVVSGGAPTGVAVSSGPARAQIGLGELALLAAAEGMRSGGADSAWPAGTVGVLTTAV